MCAKQVFATGKDKFQPLDVRLGNAMPRLCNGVFVIWFCDLRTDLVMCHYVVIDVMETGIRVARWTKDVSESCALSSVNQKLPPATKKEMMFSPGAV